MVAKNTSALPTPLPPSTPLRLIKPLIVLSLKPVFSLTVSVNLPSLGISDNLAGFLIYSAYPFTSSLS